MSSASTLPLLPNRAWHTLMNLLFGSAVSVLLLAARGIMAGHFRFKFLAWNLFLAWIPLGLAWLVRRLASTRRRVSFGGALVLWVLFFPNSFYIITDLIHYGRFGSDGISPWYDLLMVISFVFSGLLLGCLALYLLHLSVRERFGWRLGWLFAGGVLALSSFGIFLGRFVRLNSWDVFTQPNRVVDVLAALLLPGNRVEMVGFCVMFFVVSLSIYSFVVSVARLHEDTPERRLHGQELGSGRELR